MREKRSIISLRRRLIGQIGLMILGLLLLGGGAIVGINGLHHDMGDALVGYQQLRAIYEMGQSLALARTELQSNPPRMEVARGALEAARFKFETSREIQSAGLRADTLQASLTRAADDLSPQTIDLVMSQLAGFSADIRTSITASQQAADRKREATLATIVTLSLLVVASGIFIGIQQYRAVMRPLGRLTDAVRQVAAGKFSRPIEAAGDQEFVALANDFNRMASELEALYRDLEQQVATKSKELVRSERLASVGFLAAGVAHEINNPLSIITGYGERALRQLDAEGRRSDAAYKAISVMCEEAFRCKHITDRLLSLARSGSETFVPMSLEKLADAVVGNVSALPEYRDRNIVLETDPRAATTINARDGEIKQVILNLLLNALQATPAETGQVRITISAGQDHVEMIVADNGRGMSSQTLDRAFEPFFTQQRGGAPGTGLGLSITHAIVSDHDGTIRAESNGPGMGSRFIVRFPLIKQGADHAGR